MRLVCEGLGIDLDCEHVDVRALADERKLSVETGVGGVRGVVIRSGLSPDAMVVREPTSVRVGQTVRPVETTAELGEGNEL